jgi:ADP-ribose pyrophosphatase
VTDGYLVRARHERFRGPVFTVLTDEVTMPGGGSAARDYVVHIGAVAVAAVDEADQVVLVRQYRHPVGRELWELPAGLVDVAGEELPAAAARELTEEADLTAERWQLLLDLHTSPGFSNEVVRVYLARGLREVPEADRHTREHEEADMRCARVPLSEAVAMVLRGEITNGVAVAGVLGAARLRDSGWPSPARPLDEALPRLPLARVATS